MARGPVVPAGPRAITAPQQYLPGPLLLLRLRQVRQATSLSKNSIYRMEAAGQFPRRVQLTRNAVAWCEADVRAWIAARPRARLPRP